jgi:hypothetical protein
VSHHQGPTRNSGHNYIYIKFQEGWSKLDDKNVHNEHPSLTNIADDDLQSIGGPNAFIFICRKVRTDIDEDAEETKILV